MQVKLLKKYINETKQDGSPLINKKGEPFKMASIEFEVAGNTQKASMYIGGKFGAKDLEVIEAWNIGDMVEITVKQEGQYTNFSLPSRADKVDEVLDGHESRIKSLEDWAKKVAQKLKEGDKHA